MNVAESLKAMSLSQEGMGEDKTQESTKKLVITVQGARRYVDLSQDKPKLTVVGALGKPILMVKGVLAVPIIIKPSTQLLIANMKKVPWNYKWTVMTYQGKEVKEEVDEVRGLTRSGRCFMPKGLRKPKLVVSGPSSLKKPVTEEEAKEFLKKMKLPEYSIIDQLKKTPA